MGKFMTDEEIEYHRSQAKLFVPSYPHPFDDRAYLSKKDYKRALDELLSNDKYDETLWNAFHASEDDSFNGSAADLNRLLINSISNAFKLSKKEFQIWDDALVNALGWGTESLTMTFLKALEEQETEDEDEDSYA